MQARLNQIVTTSAGVLLLALAVALFLVNVTLPAKLVLPSDPISTLSMSWCFWIAGGLALVTALFCLFDNQRVWPLFLVAWLAVNFVVYWLGLWWEGYAGLSGLLGGVSYTFGISARAVAFLAELTFVYLLIGSGAALVLLSKQQKRDRNLEKMFCPACSGHIQFAVENLGQKTACPHCKAEIILRVVEKLKISCYFCKGHIEFPAHALGTKMPCPHCKMDITLKEPA